MAAHLRRWQLAYVLLWLILASSISLESGQTTLAQGVLIAGLLLATITGAVLTLRRAGQAIRRTSRRIVCRRRTAKTRTR